MFWWFRYLKITCLISKYIIIIELKFQSMITVYSRHLLDNHVRNWGNSSGSVCVQYNLMASCWIWETLTQNSRYLYVAISNPIILQKTFFHKRWYQLSVTLVVELEWAELTLIKPRFLNLRNLCHVCRFLPINSCGCYILFVTPFKVGKSLTFGKKSIMLLIDQVSFSNSSIYTKFIF